MTRTKNRVYFIAPESNPSEFLLEIKKEYKNVKLAGNWNENEIVRIDRKPCPLCGYPLQLKYKRAYGLRLYICTNEPEICGFMTNDYRAGKLSVGKCDKCTDGYLIVKPGGYEGFFLGCTNYKKNGTGCDKVVSMKSFYAQMGYSLEEIRGMGTVSSARDQKQEKMVAAENTGGKMEVTAVKADSSDYVEIKRAEIEAVMYGDKDLNDVVLFTLKALQNVSTVRYYGIVMLVDILRGAKTERILKNRLDRIPEYGVLRGLPRDSVQAVVEWLITQRMILRTKEQYPVLHPTYAGLHYSEVMTSGKLRALKRYIGDGDMKM